MIGGGDGAYAVDDCWYGFGGGGFVASASASVAAGEGYGEDECDGGSERVEWFEALADGLAGLDEEAAVEAAGLYALPVRDDVARRFCGPLAVVVADDDGVCHSLDVPFADGTGSMV